VSSSPIDAVIARMQAIDAALPRKDGVAYFNRLYLQVTEAVRTAGAGVTFHDPDFMARLDVVFAGLYFDAEGTIASGASSPPAWAPVIERRGEDLAPIQFALAGMNAHINHDLSLAVVQMCRERGVTPAAGSPQYADYEQINSILKLVEGQVAGWFETGLIADIEDVVPKEVDRAIAMWSIVAARELAWDNAKVLWSLRDTPELASAYGDLLARSVALSSAGLLV
jgi:hypothetical protein